MSEAAFLIGLVMICWALLKIDRLSWPRDKPLLKMARPRRLRW